MKIFQYKGSTYTRILPSPNMYRSQMVREVTNRGDIFALCLDTGTFTVLPGKGKVAVTDAGVRKVAKAIPKEQLKLAL